LSNELKDQNKARINGRLFYRILTIFMIQFLMSYYCVKYYYYQKTEVPAYQGVAVVILMCLMTGHMIIQKKVQ